MNHDEQHIGEEAPCLHCIQRQVTQALEIAQGHGPEHIDQGNDPIEQQVMQGHGHDEIRDLDGDTKIQVEESGDEDIIRMDVAGTERITVHNTGDILRLIGLASEAAGLKITALDVTSSPPSVGNEAFVQALWDGSTGKIRLKINLRVFDFTGGGPVNTQLLNFGTTDSIGFLDNSPSPTARHFEVIVNSETIMRHVNPSSGDSFIESVGWRPFTDAAVDFGTSSKRWKDGFFSGTIRSSSAPTSIQVGGSANIGTDAAANTSSSIDLSATDRALLLNRLTTTQRDALTPVNGMAIYRSSTNKFQIYENGAWVDWAHAAVTMSGTPDYITLTGQDIVRGLIVLTTDVTGLLPEANIDSAIARDSELHNQAHGPSDHTSFANWKVIYTDGSGDQQELALGADGQVLKATGTAAAPAFEDDEAGIEFMIDGGGSVITTGIKGWLAAPFACTIKAVRLLADQTGSIVVDLWKDTFANYPPTVADTITASAKPTISSGIKDEDATLTGWTTAVAKGDLIYYNVDSVTTIERCLVVLEVDKT